eukprot:g4850.t1
MALPTRKCGSRGFECAAQGLGCMGMSAFYGGFESEEAQAESVRVLEKVLEYGKVMLDTSDIYGPFTNEELIGKVIAGRRDQFIIATKCGIKAGPAGVGMDSTPEYVKQACDASLKRLGIDCIDLYYLHRYDRETPIEKTFAAFKELQDAGKIKYVGVSEMSADEIRRAHAVCPITAVQLEWSLFTRDAEDELIPACRELGIGIVAYSPLGRGFLTGAIKSMDDIPEGDFRRSAPRYNEQYFEENMKLVEIVKEIAAAKGCTPGQVALGWLHAQGEDVFPIPGTKKTSRLIENMGGFNIQLTDEEMKKLGVIGENIKGLRYDATFMKYTHQGHPE